MELKQKKGLLLNVAPYIFWAGLIAAAVFLMFSGRTALMTVLARYSARGFNEKMTVGALDKGFVIVAGIVVLSLSIISEDYLAKASTWTALASRVLLCLAVEASVLFVIALTIQIATRTFMGSFGSVIALFLPLAGAILTFTGARFLKQRPERGHQRQTAW